MADFYNKQEALELFESLILSDDEKTIKEWKMFMVNMSTDNYVDPIESLNWEHPYEN